MPLGRVFAGMLAWTFLAVLAFPGRALAVDCNNNGLEDACDLDCGTVGGPCDLPGCGLSADCNTNTVPDDCELLPVVDLASGQLAPFGNNSPQSFVIPIAPVALGDVTLTFTASADLSAANESVDIDINGTPLGSIFGTSGTDCPVTPDTELLIVPAATFNALAAGGDAVINMASTNQVQAGFCDPPGYIAVAIQYDTRGDCNADTVPDECEPDCNNNIVADQCDITAGTSPDCDGNGIPDECQPNSDADTWIDACDNCPIDANQDQANADGDGLGDVCDTCTDTDNDGLGDPGFPANTCPPDTCPNDPNNDADADGICGDVDTCPNDPDNDADGDGICGDIDPCPADPDNDLDGDGICGDVDPCPNDPNNDIDTDGLCGDVDPCPNDPDNDLDGDGICGDVDACPADPDNDLDGDGICGDVDVCPNDPDNDADADGICGDIDPCPADPDNDLDGDGICGDVDVCPNDPANDADSDGLCGDVDPCPLDADNDIDGDGICGDVDVCPNDPLNDADGDGICGDVDPCPADPDNDADSDGICGDVDACPNDPLNDADGDGLCGDLDNCPDHANPNQADCDSDGVGDVCVLATCNGDPDCSDCNSDGWPDVCDILHADPRLFASDGEEGDWFGGSISLSGSVALIGALRDDDLGMDGGAAYVFEYDGVSWNETAKLTAPDGAAGDFFGGSVSIDGNVAVVGATGDDDAGVSSGSAYVFRFDGQTWNFEAKLTASDAAESSRFGSVAVDGNVVVVGASRHGNTENGAAYVFEFDGINWDEVAKLSAFDAWVFDRFGSPVDVDGDVIAVKAPFQYNGGLFTGATYVYRRDAAGWQFEAKLIASDADAFDSLSGAVRINGSVIMMAATQDSAAGSGSGSVYVFGYDGATWKREAKLVPSDGKAADHFGVSIDMRGEIAVFGSNPTIGPFESTQGAFWVFEFNGVKWAERGRLEVSDPTAGVRFGNAVSLGDGFALAGASGGSGGVDTGTVYVLDMNDRADCDGDGVPNECQPLGPDCNTNGVVDACEPDCNANGIVDACEIAAGATTDCDQNGVPDECDLAFGAATDCDSNDVLDVCDTNVGAMSDCDSDGLSDACELNQFDTRWIFPTDFAPDDSFGWSVAFDGEWVVVGAPEKGTYGAVYLAQFDNGQWSRTTKLIPSFTQDLAILGVAVALEGDLLVAAAAEIESPTSFRGIVFVFRFDGSEWIEEQILVSPDEPTAATFGKRLAISEQKIMAASTFSSAPATDPPGAYVFRDAGSMWILEDKLEIVDPNAAELIDMHIAIDGDSAVLGDGFRSFVNSSSKGPAYVFGFIPDLEGGGGQWVQQAKLRPEGAFSHTTFGFPIAIQDGTIAIGGIGIGANTTGIFRRQTPVEGSQSAWILEAVVDGDLGVALQGGLLGTVDRSPLTTRLFQRQSSAPGAWREVAEIDRFGHVSSFDVRSISIGDKTVVVGNPERGEGFEGAVNSYTFRFDCNSNGVPDDCELADGLVSDCNGNGWPDDCDRAAGNLDGRGVTDGADVAGLSACMTPPCLGGDCLGAPLYADPCCALADLDLQGDVDLEDYAELQRLVGGALLRDCNGNQVGDHLEVGSGDFDGDESIGLGDLAGYIGCLTGPCTEPPCTEPLYPINCCPITDLDTDGDLDLIDYAAYQIAIGAGN